MNAHGFEFYYSLVESASEKPSIIRVQETWYNDYAIDFTDYIHEDWKQK